MLTCTGRRSAREFTLPVGYLPDGRELVVICQHAPQKRWRRNLRGGAPVVLRSTNCRLFRDLARAVGQPDDCHMRTITSLEQVAVPATQTL